MKIKNVFTSGKMNKDLDERLVPNGEYVDALNVMVSNSSGSDVGAIEASSSNIPVGSLALGSNAKTIGTISDESDGTIYWAVVSDSGSYICEYSEITGQSMIVLSDNRTTGNILNFQNDTIVDFAVINDSENGKKFLLLTDGSNEPKYFNVDDAKALPNNSFLLDDVSLIKASPLNAPAISLSDTGTGENNMDDKFYTFAYRYIYANNEISALSPFSEFSFLPKEFRYDYDAGLNKSMYNFYNNVAVSINTGDERVKKIEIIVKESGTDAYYIVQKIDKADEGLANNATKTIQFNNNKVYKALDSNQILRVYDNVPISAKSVETIGNRIVFANYKEGYNMSNGSTNVVPNLSLSYSSATGTSGNAHTTMKSNFDYEVGIAYLDGKGRMTTPFTSDGNTTHVSSSDSNKKNTLNVGISSKAPDWATNYRLFIKQNKTDYDVISPVRFYNDGVYVWIKLEGEDINKVKSGDFLFIKSDTAGIRDTPLRTKVLEAKVQSRNFLSDSTDTNTNEESGNYIKISGEEVALNTSSINTFSFEGIAFRSDSTVNNVNNNISYVESPVFYGDGLDDMSITGTYSNDTDLRYEIRIYSTGSIDSIEFRYRDCKTNTLSAWNNNNGSGWFISSSTSLGNGIFAAFSAITGHTLDDKWVVNAKSSARADEWDKDSDPEQVGTDHRKAIMNFRCKTVSGGESIQAGAVIKISWDDSLSSPDAPNQQGYVYQSFVSSRDYANLEEWFWEDNVITKMTYPEDESDVMFRRGTATIGISEGQAIDVNPSGDLWLLMVTKAYYSGTTRVKAETKLKIEELANNIILETDYKSVSSEVFYELPYTYSIDGNGNHLGGSGDTNQSGATAASLSLNYYNAFGWYNGYESIKIGDAFNEVKMLNDTKPLVPVDNYRQVSRTSSLTYSGVYESSTSYNAINEFNLATANYKDLDSKYGAINKIVSREGDIIVFQKNRVSRILYAKNVLYNADGSGNVQSSFNVLGQDMPYLGEYGVHNNPYSVVVWGNNVYWADERRRSILRLGGDGITPISNYGMSQWFNNNMGLDTGIVGTFDPQNDKYVLSLKGSSVQWLEDTWICVDDGLTTTTTSTTTTTTAAPTTAAPTTCTPAGTLLTTYCSGVDLWGTYADGSCGTYDALIESNSASCTSPTTTTTSTTTTSTTTTTTSTTTTTTTTAAPVATAFYWSTSAETTATWGASGIPNPGNNGAYATIDGNITYYYKYEFTVSNGVDPDYVVPLSGLPYPVDGTTGTGSLGDGRYVIPIDWSGASYTYYGGTVSVSIYVSATYSGTYNFYSTLNGTVATP